MKRLRSVLFWMHLTAGVMAGLVILIMSFTGAVLAMKPQIVKAIDRRVRVVAPRREPRVPASALVAAVRAGRPGATATSLTIDRDPAASAAVGIEGATIYVDPYEGSVLGEGSTRTQTFFRTIENWHRWIGLSAENRALAKSITGASNLAFLALAVSGVYLWWPRKWSAQHTRPILAFKRAATARARDFNWHNVIGFWCAPVIIVMTATATVLSYAWASDLLYRAMGSTPPSANRAAPPSVARSTSALTAEQIDRAWTRADALMPTWSVMTVRLPNQGSGAISFTISDRRSWNVFARSQLTVDTASGEVRQWQPYENFSLGQKARGWFRFAHTGELAGITGQLIAGVACAGGVALVWTGLSLALRRLVNWRLWIRLGTPAR